MDLQVIEKGVKGRVRFPVPEVVAKQPGFKNPPTGNYTTEDLFRLPESIMEAMYGELEMKSKSTVRHLFGKVTTEDQLVQLQMKILERVSEIRKTEELEKARTAEVLQDYEKYDKLIASAKEREEVGLGVEELMKRRDALPKV